MNGTPRALNRVLLFIIGVKLLAVGLLLVLLATVPAVAAWWHGFSAGVWAGMENAFRQTRLPGHEESWLWIVAGAVLVAVIVAMIAWLSQQGKGRANLLVASDDDSHIDGEVRIGGGVAEQALRAALAERTDLAAASVATYEVRGSRGCASGSSPGKEWRHTCWPPKYPSSLKHWTWLSAKKRRCWCTWFRVPGPGLPRRNVSADIAECKSRPLS